MEIYRLSAVDHLKDISYEVTLVDDRVRVETRVDFVARERREHASEKRKVPMHVVQLDLARGHWSPGEGVKVIDGWIMGWDVGEFGGGLYWFSNDGSKRQKIDDRNTSDVTLTGKGVFALQSLEHMMFSYSRFISIRHENEKWTIRLISDLHVGPDAVLYDSDRFLYVAQDYVSTLELDGTQREIYRSPRELRPGGFYRRNNGELWIGTSRALLCLAPTANREYKPYWFRPLKSTQ